VTTPIFFSTPAAFRKWLAANHAKKTELLVGFYKTSSGKPSITWPESVDEALCFGWIDGVRKSLGDEAYTIRFTPRKATSIWSAINIRRFGELDALGLVHPKGRAAFERRDEARSRVYSYENRSRGFDAATEAELRRHKLAWKFFEAQAPSYRRVAAFWVMSAKQEETRKRRLARLIEHSQNGERVPAFVSSSRRRAP